MHTRWLEPRPSPYGPVWDDMRAFTQARTPDTPDEIWLTEHEPVYTLGQAGKPEHVLAPGDIPVLATDRGGQVTYHGPGQITAYVLMDLRRAGYFVKEYVHRIEAAVLQTLGDIGVRDAQREPGAPGIYVPDPDDPHRRTAKIAALGIKVSRGCTYHGVSLNVAMDLTPYDGINPCGYAGLRTVDLRACGIDIDVGTVGERLARHLGDKLAAASR